MELRQIQFAVAVADDRHFGRAAERMFIATASTSKDIGVRTRPSTTCSSP
jgi:DNA-binding transcriptional LysR family regulator